MHMHIHKYIHSNYKSKHLLNFVFFCSNQKEKLKIVFFIVNILFVFICLFICFSFVVTEFIFIYINISPRIS